MDPSWTTLLPSFREFAIAVEPVEPVGEDPVPAAPAGHVVGRSVADDDRVRALSRVDLIARFAGLSPEESLARSWPEAIYGEDRESVLAEWRQAMAAGHDETRIRVDHVAKSACECRTVQVNFVIEVRWPFDRGAPSHS